MNAENYMEGLVLSTKNRAGEEIQYSIWTVEKKRIADFTSSIQFEPGDGITAHDEGSVLHTVDVSSGTLIKKEYEKWANSIVDKTAGMKPYVSGIEGLDITTEKMWKKLLGCGSLFLKKIAGAAPVIVRFHNDADGAGGAYGLFAGITDFMAKNGFDDTKSSIIWIMHTGIAYNRYDAESDLMLSRGYSSLEKPLLVLVDFGTSLESNDGIETLHDDFDVIWLDHHPIVEGFEGLKFDCYVNPWMNGGDSNYTAGYLACTFAKTFSNQNTLAMEGASLIGDYSRFAAETQNGADLSILLDMLTSDAKVALGPAVTGITPYEIDKIISNPGRMSELVSYAKMRLSESISDALLQVKKYNANDAKIYVLDFEDVKSEETRYPLPGRFSSKFLETLSEMEGSAPIVVVHSGRYISIRVDRKLSERMDLAEVLQELKETDEEAIEAAGGHRMASGIKLSSLEDKNRVVKDLVSVLKRNLEK